MKKVNALFNEIKEKGISSTEALELTFEKDIYYIYLGQRQGMVVNYGVPLFTPKELVSSQSFRLDYHQDHVGIFEINEAECGQ